MDTTAILNRFGDAKRNPKKHPHGCDCYHCLAEKTEDDWERAMNNRLLFQLAQANVPKNFRDNCTLESFRPINGRTGAKNNQMKAVMDLCNKFVNDFVVTNGAGLLFCGVPGTGKTHLAVGILRELVQRCYRCQFYTMAELLQHLRDANKPQAVHSEKAIMDHLASAHLLVIDDFITQEQMSDFTHQKLYEIIDNRYQNNSSLLLTTNYIPDALKQMLDARTYSRIMAITTEIVMPSTVDFREVLKKERA